jgi:diacylglycerol kinase family enzyme
VVSLLNRQREKWKMTGKISYASAILRAFFSYRKPEIEIRADDFTWRGKALMCVACKGSTFGHGLIIAPDARLDSGMLHCVLLGKVSLMDYVRNLSRLKKGQKIEHPEAHYFQTKSLLIELHSGILRQESDGELGGTGSFRFSVEPGRLKLLQTPIS